MPSVNYPHQGHRSPLDPCLLTLHSHSGQIPLAVQLPFLVSFLLSVPIAVAQIQTITSLVLISFLDSRLEFFQSFSHIASEMNYNLVIALLLILQWLPLPTGEKSTSLYTEQDPLWPGFCHIFFLFRHATSFSCPIPPLDLIFIYSLKLALTPLTHHAIACSWTWCSTLWSVFLHSGYFPSIWYLLRISLQVIGSLFWTPFFSSSSNAVFSFLHVPTSSSVSFSHSPCST